MKLVAHILLLACILASAALVSAGDERRLPTIGLAIPVDPATDAPFQKAFRDGLRDLGYVDGANVKLLVRYANGDPAKLDAIVRELVALKVDVLIGDAPVLKAATSTIPIVSPTMSDPVKTGLVESLARPGGNLTGMSWQSFDILPKQLELAKEIIPGLRRLCMVFDPSGDPELWTFVHSELPALARQSGMTICPIPVSTATEIQGARRVIRAEQPQAVLAWATALIMQHRQTIIDSVAQGLPVFSEGLEMAKSGVLFAYSTDDYYPFRRAAAYVDKILKGAKPGELPIEQPTKFALIVNLRTAKRLSITIPESILLRADETIR